MNLFFYVEQNNNMKKIFIVIISFICMNNIYAIENITIDNNKLIPSFDKNIHVYNYFTNNDEVYINVVKKNNEEVFGDGIVKLNDKKTSVIVDNSFDKYTINIFKNYNKLDKEESYIKNISIDGYDIKYDRNIYEYSININNEEFLNINCELSNMDDYYSIEGNGNFNKSDNIIRIKSNDSEYIIHAYKSIHVSKIENDNQVREFSNTKKEIVKILLITISCAFISFYYRLLFRTNRYI